MMVVVKVMVTVVEVGCTDLEWSRVRLERWSRGWWWMMKAGWMTMVKVEKERPRRGLPLPPRPRPSETGSGRQ